MTALNSLSDSRLITQTGKLVREEREILVQVLAHFQEIWKRRLFAEFHYKSLFEMMVKHYGYSESEAYRRISAMKLITELPEVKGQIHQGHLSLTHLSMAQSLFKQEAKSSQALSKEAKLEVMEKLSQTSTREAEKVILSQSSDPVSLRPESSRMVTEEVVELRFTVPAIVEEKLQRLKGLCAHQAPGLSRGELLDKLCDLALREWDPSTTKRERQQKANPKVAAKDKQQENQKAQHANPDANPDANPKAQEENLIRKASIIKAPVTITTPEGAQALSPKTNITSEKVLLTNSTPAPQKRCSKYLSSQVRREVFRRGRNQCSRCQSTYALEVDHIHPQGMGGSSELSNLRLLCRACNQRAAIRSYGQQQMEGFLL